MAYQELKNPPILESVFFIRLKEQIDKKAIIAFCDSELTQKQYGINNPSFKHADSKGDEGSSRSEQYGRVLRSNAEEKILRVNLDSISYHCLQYRPFEVLYEEFSQIIKELISYTDFLYIDRISLRYINLIKVDVDSNDTFRIEDYVSTYVESPFPLYNYFLQINVSDDEDKYNRGIITQTLRENKDKSSLEGMIVDIQVLRDIDFSYEESASRQHFFNLRRYKNHLFFSTIQPNVLETYK